MPEGAVSVGATTTVELLETIHGRKNVRFQADPANTANVAVNHKKEVATSGLNKGIILPPGAIMTLNFREDNDIDWAWYAIAASGTQTINVNVVM